jgi:hypothetical protein
MSVQKKILRSSREPEDKNWLWLREKAGKLELCEFNNGRWVSTSSNISNDQHASIKPDTPAPVGEYVTKDQMNQVLSTYVTNSSLLTALNNYVKKSDLPDMSAVATLQSDVATLKNTTSSLSSTVSNINTTISGMQTLLNSKVSLTQVSQAISEHYATTLSPMINSLSAGISSLNEKQSYFIEDDSIHIIVTQQL